MHAQPASRASPSRAQAIRDSVVIRLAVDAAGPAIAAVLKENGIVLEAAHWERVFPHWLLATRNDDVIGCCQVLVAKPVGFVEFMFVRPSAPFKIRAIAMRKLIIESMRTLYHGGAQYVGGVVAVKNRKFADVLDGLNFVRTYTADMHVKRLA